jgi:hypothetical protein
MTARTDAAVEGYRGSLGSSHACAPMEDMRQTLCDPLPAEKLGATRTKSGTNDKSHTPHAAPNQTVSAGNRDGFGRTATAALFAAAVTEREWQAKVVDLARWRGWMVFHPFDSRRSAAGWPDLALCRNGRLVLAELKTATGRVSPDQRRWLAALSAVPGVETYLWRPSDWPTVLRILGGDPSGDHLPRTQIAAANAQVTGPVSCGCLANEPNV